MYLIAHFKIIFKTEKENQLQNIIKKFIPNKLQIRSSPLITELASNSFLGNPPR